MAGSSFHNNLRGRDLHSPSNELIENVTGSQIVKGSVVTYTGIINQYPRVRLINSILDTTRGIAIDNINNGESGYICCLGIATDMDTHSWIVGTKLYSDLNGQLTTVMNGLPVATVLKQDAIKGILYVDNTGLTVGDISGAYEWVAWALLGNDSIPSNAFLGTKDNHPILIKTNNISRGIITEEGRWGINTSEPKQMVHIKSNTGNVESGKRLEPFTFETDSSDYQVLYQFAVPMGSLCKFRINALGKQGINRGAVFERTLTLYRDGGIAQKKMIQSDYTYKSNNNFDIIFEISMDTLYVKIKNANAVLTNWGGTVEIDVI